ncbi:DUF4365 domain-containing protein [Salegentibacter agarivorans]
MRHRTHLLEEESFFELKKKLPKEWVIREKPKDYGIDVEIEIFNSKGRYTGLVFWIQLKATDSDKTKDQKSVRMAISKINQLASYELPVALFRYNSENKEFYFEWMVRYRFLSSSSKNKTFLIEFEDHHLWSENSVNNIISYLNKKEHFNKGSFSFPIRGFVNDINIKSKISRKLSASISEHTSLIKITRDRRLADIEINVLKNRIVLNFSGAYGSSIGFKKTDLDKDDLIYSAFNTALVLLLVQTGKDSIFFDYIKQNNLLDGIINNPPILRYLLPKLITADIDNQFTEEIVEAVFKSNDPITQTTIQAIIILSNENAISHDRIEKYFQQVIELFTKSKNLTSLASTYYNFGNYYRGIRNLEQAFRYYKNAYKIDKVYLTRGYFYQELAGILFDLDFYNMSSRLYLKARELESGNIFLLATQADADFYSGNYERALNLFDDFLLKNINGNHNQSEFSLKFTILKTIIETYEIKKQRRNVDLLKFKLKSISKKELEDEDELYKLLQIDALNPYIWVHYALIGLKSDDFMLHYIASMVQAVIIKSDPKLWAYLTILSTYDKSLMKFLYDISNTAYFYCREKYFSLLGELLELENNKDLNDKDFLSYIESLVPDPKEYPTELRLWNGDEVNIFNL